jgi:hypothetical protein
MNILTFFGLILMVAGYALCGSTIITIEKDSSNLVGTIFMGAFMVLGGYAVILDEKKDREKLDTEYLKSAGIEIGDITTWVHLLDNDSNSVHRIKRLAAILEKQSQGYQVMWLKLAIQLLFFIASVFAFKEGANATIPFVVGSVTVLAVFWLRELLWEKPAVIKVVLSICLLLGTLVWMSFAYTTSWLFWLLGSVTMGVLYGTRRMTNESFKGN